jgi:hypothetical protein
MADDDLDELYWVKPADFTATRTRLAKAAKERGDDEAAREISASRKPTTAAWIANRLAISHTQTQRRLSDLRDRLRAAHATRNGARIRELTHEQRKLIDQLAAQAFDTSEVKAPSAALRDEVVATLQAAVADPDVTQRLGRLAKAQRWSGFGDFGAAVPELSVESTEHDERDEKLEGAKAALAEAEQAKAAADEELSDREAALRGAQRALKEAQRDLDRAEAERNDARRARDDAAEEVEKARAECKRLGR